MFQMELKFNGVNYNWKGLNSYYCAVCSSTQSCQRFLAVSLFNGKLYFEVVNDHENPQIAQREKDFPAALKKQQKK